MLALTADQIDKLSDLLMALAKGLFLAAFAIPILTKADFLVFSKSLLGGIIFAYLSLKLLELKRI